MDPTDIISRIRAGLDLVQRLEPLASLAGPGAAGIANVVAGLAQIGEAALENIETGIIAANGDQQDELKTILRELQTRNDALTDNIRKGG